MKQPSQERTVTPKRQTPPLWQKVGATFGTVGVCAVVGVGVIGLYSPEMSELTYVQAYEQTVRTEEKAETEQRLVAMAEERAEEQVKAQERLQMWKDEAAAKSVATTNAQLEFDLREAPQPGMTLEALREYLPKGTYTPSVAGGIENFYTTDKMTYIIRNDKIFGYEVDVNNVSIYGRNFAALNLEQRLEAIQADNYNPAPIRPGIRYRPGIIECEQAGQKQMCSAAFKEGVPPERGAESKIHADKLVILFDQQALAKANQK